MLVGGRGVFASGAGGGGRDLGATVGGAKVEEEGVKAGSAMILLGVGLKGWFSRFGGWGCRWGG